jgi:outer membrane protein
MKILAILSALFLGGLAVSFAQEQPITPVVAAPAESAPPPLPVKVATIFGQNAIVSTQEGQKASAALDAKYAPKRDEFARKQTELQALREQLKRSMAAADTAARDRLNRSIDAKNKELLRLEEDIQEALGQEEGALLQRLGDKLLEIIRQYAARNGYAVVFDVSLPQGPVLWGSPTVDITNEIVRLYDQAHPVAPAPAASPATKK